MNNQYTAELDHAEHERTYRRFVSGLKWAVIGNAIALLLLAWFLL